jgi:signal transduction histidine kinase
MQGAGDTRLKQILHKAHADAVQARKEIVRLMMDLRPTLLDDLGMPAAIHRYSRDTLEPRGISVSMECTGSDQRLPAEVEVALFRVTQGLISNVVKHSHATSVSIRVECDSSHARLRIEDDGSGFDPEQITEIEPDGRGAGLFTMRERLRLVGGTSRIESSPGKGTRITVTVPIVKSLGDLANEQDKSLDR